MALGVRRKVQGSAEKPRLSVFRSNRHFYCQAIDDERGVTMACVSSQEADFKQGDESPMLDHTKKLGGELANRLKSIGVERAVFDRGWYRYHGCVKNFADAVREGGIRF